MSTWTKNSNSGVGNSLEPDTYACPFMVDTIPTGGCVSLKPFRMHCSLNFISALKYVTKARLHEDQTVFIYPKCQLTVQCMIFKTRFAETTLTVHAYCSIQTVDRYRYCQCWWIRVGTSCSWWLMLMFFMLMTTVGISAGGDPRWLSLQLWCLWLPYPSAACHCWYRCLLSGDRWSWTTINELLAIILAIILPIILAIIFRK